MTFLLRSGEQILCLCGAPPTPGDDRGEAVLHQLLVLGAILPSSNQTEGTDSREELN